MACLCAHMVIIPPPPTLRPTFLSLFDTCADCRVRFGRLLHVDTLECPAGLIYDGAAVCRGQRRSSKHVGLHKVKYDRDRNTWKRFTERGDRKMMYCPMTHRMLIIERVKLLLLALCSSLFFPINLSNCDAGSVK